MLIKLDDNEWYCPGGLFCQRVADGRVQSAFAQTVRDLMLAGF